MLKAWIDPPEKNAQPGRLYASSNWTNGTILALAKIAAGIAIAYGAWTIWKSE